ncbi:MAG TPA: formate dehydrogenase [Burkholderiaceae bacterium]|nr:formate dehydrogenase [Burkholderiaceae bacterium]
MDDRSNPRNVPLKSRRGFLLGAGAAGVAGAAMAATAATAAVPQQAVPAAQKDDEAARGYRVSEHVAHYYRTTRI